MGRRGAFRTSALRQYGDVDWQPQRIITFLSYTGTAPAYYRRNALLLR